MPSGNWFEKTKGELERGGINILEAQAERKGAIDKIGIDTMVAVMNTAFAPLEQNETPEDRERKMWRTYEKGVEQAIKVKYWYLPDIQRGLVEGKIYEINNKFYKYMGILGDACWEEVE